MSFFKKKNDGVKEEQKAEIKLYPITPSTSKPVSQVSQKSPVSGLASTPNTKQPSTRQNYGDENFYSSPNEFEIDLYTPGPANFSTPAHKSVPISHQPTKGPVNARIPAWPYNDEKHFPKPLYEKTGAIIFVVENTATANTYREEIVRLISKIIEDNTSSLFMLMKLALECDFSTLLSYAEVKEANLISKLLTLDDVLTSDYNVDTAFTAIRDFVRDDLMSNSTIPVKDKKFILSDARIIFIGTGEYLSYTELSSSILKALCENKNIKAIKFFCIKDSNAIKPAAMGFPVIGHLESNFYK